jgi:murein DD-endopeptidase MepM/ murein hydrolase activator NlpD
MKRWSNSGYDGSIVPHLRSKPIAQLLPNEMRELILTMAKREGYSPNMSVGTTPRVADGKERPKSLGVITTIPGTSTRFEKSHPGVDIANKPGTPIPSFVKGTVVEVVNNQAGAKSGYGNYVVVKDSDGNLHRYSHLSNSYVKVGQPVGRGTVLGGMGNTGATYSQSGEGSGTHLDYRIVSKFGQYMNPMTYIKYLS